MADAGRERVGGMVLAAWDAFLAQAERVDLDRPSRLPGWRAHEICVHLGCWDENTAMADLIASARAGGDGLLPDVDAVNARVTAAHRDASREEVLDGLRRNRAATARYLADEPVELDTAPTVSVVGRLPLLSVVLGQAYELAVHGLDLVSCGAEPPPPDVLHSGLAALVDVTGALAASMDISRPGHPRAPRTAGGVSSAIRTAGRWPRCPPAWSTDRPSRRARTCSSRRRPAGSTRCPAVARRKLKVHEVGGLLKLAPIVQAVPGIPGGPILQLAARTVGGAGGMLGRLFGRG